MLRILPPLLCLLASIATAQIYTIGAYGDNTLRLIDPTTGATVNSIPVTDSGGATIFQMNGLAHDPVTGNVYCVADLGTGRELAQLDINTGIITRVGPFGDMVSGIAFHSSGNLYAVVGDGGSFSESFQQVNIPTGVLSFIASFNSGSCCGETIGRRSNGGLTRCTGSPGAVELITNPTTGSKFNFASTPEEISCLVGTTVELLLAATSGNLHAMDNTGTITRTVTLDHSPKGIIEVICNGLYPGTSDDYTLTAGTGGFVLNCSQVPANVGDVLSVHLETSNVPLRNTGPILIAQFFTTGLPAPFVSVIGADGIWADPFASPGPFILYDGAASPLGGNFLPTQGLGFQYLVGPGFSGMSIMLNAFTINAAAANTIFAASEGIEIQLL